MTKAIKRKQAALDVAAKSILLRGAPVDAGVGAGVGLSLGVGVGRGVYVDAAVGVGVSSDFVATTEVGAGALPLPPPLPSNPRKTPANTSRSPIMTFFLKSPTSLSFLTKSPPFPRMVREGGWTILLTGLTLYPA
jgi:hypothetical protein